MTFYNSLIRQKAFTGSSKIIPYSIPRIFTVYLQPNALKPYTAPYVPTGILETSASITTILFPSFENEYVA
jgi:hypothetical protein